MDRNNDSYSARERYSRARQQRNNSRYYSLDATDDSTINNASVFNNSLPSKPDGSIRSRSVKSKPRPIPAKISDFSTEGNKHVEDIASSSGYKSLSTRKKYSVEIPSKEQFDRNFSPVLSKLSNASTLTQKNVPRVSAFQPEPIVRSRSDTNVPNKNRFATIRHRSSSVTRSNSGRQDHFSTKRDEEEEDMEDSFQLGLEPMETDISSMTDTMYSLNSKYRKYIRKEVSKNMQVHEEDDISDRRSRTGELQPEHDVGSNWQPIHDPYRNNYSQLEIPVSKSAFELHSPRKKLSIPPTKNAFATAEEVLNIKEEGNEGGSFDNAMQTINDILRERKKKAIPDIDNANYNRIVPTANATYEDDSKHTTRFASTNAQIATSLKFPIPQHARSFNSKVAQSATEEKSLFSSIQSEATSQAVSQDWAMVAVNVAASILDSGECQETAEAATAAVLAIGGSKPVDKTTALEAAAEASTVVLSVGCSQISAATVAVAVLKATERMGSVPNGVSDTMAECLTPKAGSANGQPHIGEKNRNKSLSFGEDQHRDEVGDYGHKIDYTTDERDPPYEPQSTESYEEKIPVNYVNPDSYSSIKFDSEGFESQSTGTIMSSQLSMMNQDTYFDRHMQSCYDEQNLVNVHCLSDILHSFFDCSRKSIHRCMEYDFSKLMRDPSSCGGALNGSYKCDSDTILYKYIPNQTCVGMKPIEEKKSTSDKKNSLQSNVSNTTEDDSMLEKKKKKKSDSTETSSSKKNRDQLTSPRSNRSTASSQSRKKRRSHERKRSRSRSRPGEQSNVDREH